MNTSSSSTWLRPAILLPAVIAMFLLLALFTPRQQPDDETRLTTFSTGKRGAAGTYTVLQKLGFPVEQSLERFPDTLSTKPLYIFLDPLIRLSAAEIIQLRKAVFDGAALFLAVRNDSLHRTFGFLRFDLKENYVPASAFLTAYDAVPWHTFPGNRLPQPGETTVYAPAAALSRTPQATDTTFLWYTGTRALKPRSDSLAIPVPRNWKRGIPVMAGRQFGRGQVVILSNPMLLQNMTSRGGPPIMAMSDALHWMGGMHRPVVFDEFHQGFGQQPGVTTAMKRALFETSLGRTAVHIGVAAFILLLAYSIRPLVPTVNPVIERRSLLEHVDALAHAYLKNTQHRKQRPGYATDARTLGLDRLITGLRRRHMLGVNRSLSHERYLATVRVNFQNVAPDVDALQRMLHGEIPKHFNSAATHIANIERAISPSPLPSSTS